MTATSDSSLPVFDLSQFTEEQFAENLKELTVAASEAEQKFSGQLGDPTRLEGFLQGVYNRISVLVNRLFTPLNLRLSIVPDDKEALERLQRATSTLTAVNNGPLAFVHKELFELGYVGLLRLTTSSDVVKAHFPFLLKEARLGTYPVDATLLPLAKALETSGFDGMKQLVEAQQRDLIIPLTADVARRVGKPVLTFDELHEIRRRTSDSDSLRALAHVENTALGQSCAAVASIAINSMVNTEKALAGAAGSSIDTWWRTPANFQLRIEDSVVRELIGLEEKVAEYVQRTCALVRKRLGRVPHFSELYTGPSTAQKWPMPWSEFEKHLCDSWRVLSPDYIPSRLKEAIANGQVDAVPRWNKSSAGALTYPAMPTADGPRAYSSICYEGDRDVPYRTVVKTGAIAAHELAHNIAGTEAGEHQTDHLSAAGGMVAEFFSAIGEALYFRQLLEHFSANEERVRVIAWQELAAFASVFIGNYTVSLFSEEIRNETPPHPGACTAIWLGVLERVFGKEGENVHYKYEASNAWVAKTVVFRPGYASSYPYNGLIYPQALAALLRVQPTQAETKILQGMRAGNSLDCHEFGKLYGIDTVASGSLAKGFELGWGQILSRVRAIESH